MTKANRYPNLKGSFGPVRGDVTVTELLVIDGVPDHFDGRYVRAGSTRITEPNPDIREHH